MYGVLGFKRFTRMEGVAQLRAAIEAAWNAISQDTMRRLIDSLPERTDYVMEANGWMTPKY